MIKKNEMIWNTIGSIIYSLFSAIILIFCTRINGTEIAGMFTIGYATGCILNAIGDFGIRIFQVTDVERKYSFKDYFSARFFAVAVMYVIGLIFVFVSGYRSEKLFICLVLVTIRIVDNFSETFQSEFQLNNRLDIAGKVLLIRNTIEILSFIVVDYITKNIYAAMLAMLLASIILILMLDVRKVGCYINWKRKFKVSQVKKIIIECIPLALSTLISMYVINSVKYAIDYYGSNTMQTYFNILYMPTFAINLITLLLIKPFLKPFGECWSKKENGKFIKMILEIIGVLTVFTIVAELGAFFLGIPVLNMLYSVDLNIYKIDLLVLLFSGLLYAISTVMFYALGTIRSQKSSTIAYTITAVFALVFSNFFVKKMGMHGATIVTVLIMLLLCILLTIAFAWGFRKNRNKC